MCNWDTWMIREKSTVECDGPCFKWQQSLNNSGTYSYATIRGCYATMFEQSTSTAAPEHEGCSDTKKPLTCIDKSFVLESACWCNGDHCNAAITHSSLPLWLTAALALATGAIHQM
ncbi:Protein F26F2.8 [Aphelenchoides avenae]|nr:Protein F26F2.8 [Aphelenchus avenae]